MIVENDKINAASDVANGLFGPKHSNSFLENASINLYCAHNMNSRQSSMVLFLAFQYTALLQAA
jgi:hypothetical protein